MNQRFRMTCCNTKLCLISSHFCHFRPTEFHIRCREINSYHSQTISTPQVKRYRISARRKFGGVNKWRNMSLSSKASQDQNHYSIFGVHRDTTAGNEFKIVYWDLSTQAKSFMIRP